MARTWHVLSLAALTTMLGGACMRTLRASTTEPNPMSFVREPSEEPRSSALHITVRDMEMPSTERLHNTAYFVVKSHDRLRFHVVLQQKWKEMADIKGWDVELQDDRGHRFVPESKEEKNNKHKTNMWDYERRSVIPPNNPGSPVMTEGQTVSSNFAYANGIPQDGWRERVPLASVDWFKGQGDYVFHARDIFDKNVKRLTLVMRREGLEYRFTWNFN